MLVATPTDYQLHLFHEGTYYKSFELFGSHIVKKRRKLVGTRFTVWAPNAKNVRLIGSFNYWNGSSNELERLNKEGVWTILIPDEDLSGHLYKYEIVTQTGEILHKADPYAFYSEVRPNTASIVYPLNGYKWKDANWRRKKKRQSIYEKPLFIYELHLASWKKKQDGSLYNYEELADELIPYVKEMGYTHIELLPLVEHPYDRSWGYQGTGYYSATSRYGTPHELMMFIDKCHQEDIGVILDWVPGHFCKDAHGLYMFDGTPTFEYAAYNDRENEVWGTANFDLGKTEVQSFLISNAIFWMEYFHVDGFRVDAVANMLFWPNSDELHANPFAINFLKKLNEAVYEFDYSALMIAEDSTDWPLVTKPTSVDGLGFNYKWNMGWMNDMLSYMILSPEQRRNHHNKVTFSLLYAFSENFILPLSHDEVVHGKRSLLNKMPGDYSEKFDQLRLFYGYYMTHPGKKLLFMGSEFGQWDEWKDQDQLDWVLMDEFNTHKQMQIFMKDLIKTYTETPALFEKDHEQDGFEWIDANNSDQSIFSFIRKGKKDDEFVIILCNFTKEQYVDYKIGVPELTNYEEFFTSSRSEYGGSSSLQSKESSSVEGEYHGKPYHMLVDIAPFGFSMWRPKRRRWERGNS
ncbi:1,4-alpha-glucan branching protein GlgB [Sutcliffiella cohnii]|uniref:1,4-alpha-glucan branching protein GlgB n=1 Tax=Sutcliffiella cohnii TaxID=33932 RepID=UPI002E1C5597|nr:1,4-alpha-glucan branching protein GlgB [Sutcliffiella cohnii]MED4016050.1 1,4-alpha-glucan branching protein GlgB [Sutcliffiella cohnii]